jgi:hypothetical protein
MRVVRVVLSRFVCVSKDCDLLVELSMNTQKSCISDMSFGLHVNNQREDPPSSYCASSFLLMLSAHQISCTWTHYSHSTLPKALPLYISPFPTHTHPFPHHTLPKCASSTLNNASTAPPYSTKCTPAPPTARARAPAPAPS